MYGSEKNVWEEDGRKTGRVGSLTDIRPDPVLFSNLNRVAMSGVSLVVFSHSRIFDGLSAMLFEDASPLRRTARMFGAYSKPRHRSQSHSSPSKKTKISPRPLILDACYDDVVRLAAAYYHGCMLSIRQRPGSMVICLIEFHQRLQMTLFSQDETQKTATQTRQRGWRSVLCMPPTN